MSNEPKDPQPKKTTDQIGVWLAIGAGLGTLLGIVFHNIAMGITFGAALGLVLVPRFRLRTKRIELSMQQTHLRSANATHPVPLSTYLQVIASSR